MAPDPQPSDHSLPPRRRPRGCRPCARRTPSCVHAAARSNTTCARSTLCGRPRSRAVPTPSVCGSRGILCKCPAVGRAVATTLRPGRHCRWPTACTRRLSAVTSCVSVVVGGGRVVWGCGGGAGVCGGGARARPAAGRVARCGGPAPLLLARHGTLENKKFLEKNRIVKYCVVVLNYLFGVSKNSQLPE